MSDLSNLSRARVIAPVRADTRLRACMRAIAKIAKARSRG